MARDRQTKRGQSGSQGVLLGRSVKRAEVNWHSEGAYHSPGDGWDEVEDMKVGARSRRRGDKVGKKARRDDIIP